MTNMEILFCEDPLVPKTVDPDFREEFDCAIRNGFKTILFNYDDLTSGNIEKATRPFKPLNTMTTLIYRGWMLTPNQYADLYNKLLVRNYNLINSSEEYHDCHYLPYSLPYIKDYTPKTIFEKITDPENLHSIISRAGSFGHNPIIVKDYVKSEKHHWDTACYIKQASDKAALASTLNNFLRLRGQHLNEGIVIREFVELNELTTHSKSGMPLKEEYRLFFFNKNLLGIYDYWEEGEYKGALPETKTFEIIATKIPSNFFSMDIARKKSGELIIIELGDGQVTGLPDKLDKNEFYRKLKNPLS